MRHKFITLVVLGSFAVVAAQSTSTRQTRAWLVRLGERDVSLHSTAGPNNVGNCLVVTPDGRALLELQRQEFFDMHPTQAIYEGTLSAKGLDILRTILQDDAIRALPQFVAPTTPMGADSFHVVTAQINRPPDIQEIGYFEWQGAAPANAESVGENWSRAATAMKPLVEWFHAIKSTFPFWRLVSKPTKNVCGES